jgi:hypothetical protein
MVDRVGAEALFVRDGDAYVGTILTQGGWDPQGANGGTVLALLGQLLDGVPTLVPMTLSRLTVDLVRPVPIGRPLHVTSAVLREGKKIQVVQLQLLVDGVEHVRATALRLRDADLTGEPVPPSTTDARPADALLSPDEALQMREVSVNRPGFLQAIDLRRARTRDGSRIGCWLRLDVPVVAGRPISPTARCTVGMDFANLVGLDMTPMTASVTMINPDVSAHLLRPPVGEWIAVTGDTRFQPGLGRGISVAELSDEQGVFGVASVSQLIQHR